MFNKYDAYKDSELPSFGNVPNHWQVIPLCSITTLKSITNVVNEELLSVYLDKGVIRFDDVTEKRTNVTSLDLSKYQLVEEGDFVLNNQQAWRGSVGVSTYRGIVSPAYLVLKLSPKVDAKFANYFFRNSAMVSQYLINSKGVGTIQRNLYWQHLKRSNVVLPPTQEQTQIAEFLDHKTSEIDQAIAIKEQQIALLNERKQIVIQKAVTQGLNPNVAMKDSGVEWIGQIPEHWEISRIKHLGKILNGFAFPSDSFTDQGVRVLKISNIQTMTLDWQDESYIDEKWKKIATNALVYKGDLVFALTRPIISTGLKATIIDSDETMLLNQRNAVLRPNNKVIKEWLYYVLLADGFVQEFEKKIDITGQQPNISTVSIGNLPLVYPTLDEQVQICETLERICQIIDEAINVEKKSIHQLKEYKTTLINDAVTGKIKVA